MGLLYDTLRGWLSPTVEGRRAGRAALAGRMLGADPVRVTHPAADGFSAWHYPKRARACAVTLTLGLPRGHELLAFTLGDTRDPQAEPMVRVLHALAEAEPGEVVALPEGTLGRSAHRHAVIAGPPVLLDGERLADWEGVLGAHLQMVLTLTDPEASFVAERGPAALLERMAAQGVVPACDRRAGDVRLDGPA